jgi:hypothetical protein
VARAALVLALSALLLSIPVACASDSDESGAATTEVVTREESEREAKRLVPASVPMAERRRVYAELARTRDRGVSGSAVYEQVARRTGVPLSSVLLIEREGSLRSWPLPVTRKLPPSAVRAGRPWGATLLRSTTRCAMNARRTGIANLRWRPARPGGQQWIAVTNLLRGFEFGQYEAVGPLPATRRSFEWRRVHGQSIHRWRVITRVGGRWRGSPTATFTGPTCIAEFEQ